MVRITAMRIRTHPRHLSFQSWFAWYPIKIEETPGHFTWFWLETVCRRWVPANLSTLPYVVDSRGHWEYKVPE